PAKYRLLIKMIKDDSSNIALNKLILHHLDNKTVMQSSLAQKILTNVLRSMAATDEYIELVTRYKVRSENKNLLQLALDKPNKSMGKNAAGLLLQFGGGRLAQNVIHGEDTTQQYNLLTAIGGVGSNESIDMLQSIALSNKYDIQLRKHAAQEIGKSESGEERVLKLLRNKKVPAELIPDLVTSVENAWRGSVRKEAESFLPEGEKNIVSKKAPSLQEILSLSATADEGIKVFTNNCSVCHQVNGTGYDFGPNLSGIGSKLPKEGLFDAIVHPSKGINFGYENWELKMKDGSIISGIIASKTATDIDMKFAGGGRKQIKRSDVKSMRQMKVSAMPENLYATMSSQDVASLLEYLKGLKKK
ncbi:MAG: c-type cytochrome, partial [Ginsengibacter sp.]